MLLVLFPFLAFIICHVLASQSPLGDTTSLAQLSRLQFVTFAIDQFPGHSIRIKKSDFCDPTVNVYTGYLDIDQGAKHLFFYYFESRRDPATDDVIMWINGGPGCSSAMGLLMELGPCSIDMNGDSKNGTLWNPYSWTSQNNVFFLDQPVGVGFSYASYGETVETTEDAAKNIYAFLTIFFETFKDLSGRPFHLSGESYGGRYLPVFASEIIDRNARAKKSGGSIINLKSVLIGNGITDISTLYRGRYDIQCTANVSLSVPLHDISACVRMKLALPRCDALMKRECIDRFDAMSCSAAVEFCDAELSAPFWATKRNVYDVSKPCIGGGLCYLETGKIMEFLNQPSVREQLGVETPESFNACSEVVGSNFVRHMDKWAVPTQYYVAQLLERGIKVLIYAGTYDFQCNWVANHLWTDALEWSGSKEFSSQPLREWYLDGKVVGKSRTANGLTFATIDGAGHMVPYDKPVESLVMLHRWLADGHL